MPADSWRLTPGVNHVGAYQVSGRPFVSGNIDTSSKSVVFFQGVTRWVYVQNQGKRDLRVAFSEDGMDGNNYFVVHPESGSFGPVELKCSEVWLYTPSGDDAKVNVVAGLTLVAPERISGSGGRSYAGIYGVG